MNTFYGATGSGWGGVAVHEVRKQRGYEPLGRSTHVRRRGYTTRRESIEITGVSFIYCENLRDVCK